MNCRIKTMSDIADKVVLHNHCDCTEQNREMRTVLLEVMDFVKEIHKMVASSDMRSRLAFSSADKAEEKVAKLIEKNKFKKNKINKSNWQGGINV